MVAAGRRACECRADRVERTICLAGRPHGDTSHGAMIGGRDQRPPWGTLALSFSIDPFGAGSGWTRHEGSSPSPFDALDRHRLAGPNGSHPLHLVRPEELVRRTSGPLRGGIEIDGSVRVGESISGRLQVTPAQDIRARGAVLRLVGLKLVEQRRSESHRNAVTNTASTEEWVEATGQLFEALPFTDPPIPPVLAAGAALDTAFTVPAPRLGPPSAHLGEAIVAWALDVRWDVALHEDAFVACLVPVLQNPDLIRAGVGEQGGLAMLDTYAAPGGATVSVTTPLPARPGTRLGVRAVWPMAPDGNARVELHRRTNAPNGVEGILSSVALPSGSLRGGADAQLEIPADCAPSFDGAGLEIIYVVRVLVDRRLRMDAAIERPVAIA